MQFSALKQELSDRGFTYLSDTRLGQYINAGYHELNEEELWDWRHTTVTGAPPLTLTNPGPIEEVVDTANNYRSLAGVDRRTLREGGGDLTTTGRPSCFYRDDQSTVRVFPVGGTLSCRYYATAADLASAGDVPIIPARYHLLIVDYAAREAYSDRDNFDEAAQVELKIQRKLPKLIKTCLTIQVANGDYQVVYENDGEWV